MRASARLLVLLALTMSVACGPTVDLTKGLQVTIANSGWYDLGIVNGQNKLVPMVTFTLRNTSDQKLVTLQINALFRRVTENTEWGSGFVTVVGSQGLAPARLHRQRAVAAGDAAEHAFRRREGGAVRQVRIDPVGPTRHLPDYASALDEVTSAASVRSASVPSLTANSRNDRGESRIT